MTNDKNRAVNSATPICRDCVHGPQLNRYTLCSRWPKKPDLVHGEKIARLENCYDERNRGFFDRLYGIDKCGPEGKYFEARGQAASPFAENANKSTEQFAQNVNCPSLKGQIITDAVSRQNVVDAIAGERLNEDTGSEGDAAYERALDDVLEAINAIPAVTVTVTDEMCLNAGNAFHDALTAGLSAPEAMKAALVAALGD